MSGPPAPIRFLLLVVGGWVTIRAGTSMPWWTASPRETAVAQDMAPRARAAVPAHAAATPSPLPGDARPVAPAAAWTPPARSANPFAIQRLASPPRSGGAESPIAAWSRGLAAPAGPQIASRPPLAGRASPASIRPVLPGLRPPASRASRLTGYAWLFVRDRGDPGLAPGGTLGGSQAGARLTYRLNGDARRPVSLSGRVYAPLDRPAGAEAAVGIDWRPIAGLPLNLLAERRQRLGREGRSDFSLILYGGTEARLLNNRVRIEAYGQAGIVGIEEGDLFADGGVVATTRIGPVEVGGGAWGGAQPGSARFDLGPHASVRLPAGRATLRAAAEWRFRVAGDAAPASGPALTILAGF